MADLGAARDPAQDGRRGDAPATASRPSPLARIARELLLTSHFQPIVDLHTGNALGWEVLSRGPGFLPSPVELFALAEAEGLTLELEQACRTVALRTIAEHPRARGTGRFFLNVSPRVLATGSGFLREELMRHGLDQSDFVIEVTERESIHDYGAFERQVRHYVEQGFKIALDDFGAGHSGLVTLVTCLPHFLKVDMSLVRDIHLHAYKQHLLRSLITFASSVNAALIAEGVETWDELEALARFGIRYAQGFLLARPGLRPTQLEAPLRERVRGALRQFNHRESDLDETVAPLVIRCECVREGDKRGEDLDRMFRKDPALDHMVIVRDEEPVGLITRRTYYARTGGPVGYHLFQRRAAESLAQGAPLVVRASMHVTSLAKLAMERAPEEIYDPVVVVDDRGRLLGTVTIRQLIMRSTALEVATAQSSNPLTGLPGNRSIERWIQAAMDVPGATVIYADLDRFKEYNDRYGFVRGDDMIRCLARVLSNNLARLGPDALLGHIGGDDFVVVTGQPVTPEAAQALCEQFDAARAELFDPGDVQAGCFQAMDRTGRTVSVPLVTLSLAVVWGDMVQDAAHPGALAQLAASLKRKVKETTAATRRSAFLFERRRLRSASPGAPPEAGDQAAPAVPGAA